MDKVNVTQDFLYQFLQEHNLPLVMISRKMGVSESIVGGSFRHALNRHGKPLKFSEANIDRLNAAIQQIAAELRDSLVVFGSDRTFTNRRGSTYDPGTLPAIKRLGAYFNMSGLTERLLGWKKSKHDMIISVKSARVYGNITQEDVDRINAELLSVSGVLSSYKIVSDITDANTNITES